MRILLVTGAFPPMPCGIGDYTARLAQALARLDGARVGVLTSAEAGGAHPEGVELFPIARRWRLEEAGPVWKRIRSWRPDILHVQYPSLVYGPLQWILPAMGWIHRCGVVQTWHEYYSPRNWPSVLNALVPGGLVVVRPRYEESVPRWYRALMRWKVLRFIPNASSIPAVRLTEQERQAVRARLGVRGGLVAFFGFASPAKGIEALFEIADPRAQTVVVVGQLDPSDDYQRRILERVTAPPWADRAVVTGFLEAPAVAEILAAADAVVLPFRDGAGEWNTSVHAAVAQGTFVVTTSRERRGYDPATNVFWVEPGDGIGMQQALSEHLGRRLSPAGGEQDPWRAIAGSHLDLYRLLLEGDLRRAVAGGRFTAP